MHALLPVRTAVPNGRTIGSCVSGLWQDMAKLQDGLACWAHRFSDSLQRQAVPLGYALHKFVSVMGGGDLQGMCLVLCIGAEAATTHISHADIQASTSIIRGRGCGAGAQGPTVDVV